MTAKIITTYIAAGYTLSSKYSQLTITATGGIGGTGLFAGSAAQVFNDGIIHETSGSNGVNLAAGGLVQNGDATHTAASITGATGVNVAGGAGAIANFGTIDGATLYGVYLRDGGSVTNGAAGDPTALIQGTGGVDVSGGPCTVANLGTIQGSDAVHQGFGVYFNHGGRVTNGSTSDTAAEIQGFHAVVAYSAGAVINYGTIIGSAGGIDINFGAGSVTNYGAIAASGGQAVYLLAGGNVANGAPGHTGAIMTGYIGVQVAGAPGSVSNQGTIIASGGARKYGFGILLSKGGQVVNGSAADHAAVLQGQAGVLISSAAGTVANFGTIQGTAAGGFGVFLQAGGAVTNGASNDTAALIEGVSGISLSGGAGTVINFGTITGASGGFGIGQSYPGAKIAPGVFSLTNGSAADTTALISGDIGVYLAGPAATLTNYGTILGTGPNFGYGVGAATTTTQVVLINGSTSDTAALIEGPKGGLALTGAMAAVNFGTISTNGTHSTAADFVGTGSVTNGSANDKTTLIEGFYGLGVGNSQHASGAITVTNFGTIEGTGGTGIKFFSPGSTLVAEAGSTVIGVATGGGGTLELAGGTGTITGLGATGSVSGGESMTFNSFGAYVIDVGGAWTLTGTNTLAAGKTLTVDGALTLASGQTFTVNGAIANAGTIALANGGSGANLVIGSTTTLTGGGTVSLGTALLNRLYGATASTVLDNVDNTISGSGFIGLSRLTLINGAKGIVDASGGTIVLRTTGETVSNTGLLEGTAGGHLNLQNTTVNNAGGGIISAAAGSTVGLQGATLIGGTLQTTGNGVIVTFNGANLVDGTTSAVFNQGALSIADNTALTMQGSIVNSGRIVVNATAHTTHLTVGAAGLTLSGGGQLTLSDNAFNRVSGVTAAATLANVDNKISGAGQLGTASMVLINQAKGTIDATGKNALVVNTGTNTVTNAGLIEAAGAGGLTIVGAVANTGILEAAGGVLTADGAVTGSGSAIIASGTLDFVSTFAEAVKYTGTTGVLELAHAQTYTGSVTGFSKTGGTSLDLRDIAFKSAGQATFSGTATSGTLTVTDGTHTAHITLIGDYRSSTFTASSDGHGGVTIHDPAPAQRFIAAAAVLGAGGGAAVSVTHDIWRTPPPMLARPGVAMA